MTYPHLSTECGEHHDLVRDFESERPAIVVLCGSTRFADEFHAQNLLLTLAGKIVLSIGCDTKSDADLSAAGVTFDDDLKARLDALHKRKIDLADEVLIVSDETGYFGDSTASEIAYAVAHGKPVRFVHESAGERWATSASLGIFPPSPAGEAAAAFNAEHPIGTVVDYWRGVRSGEPSGRGRTRHPAAVLSGHTPVVWIEGCSGCIALTHVHVVPAAEATP